MPAAQKPSNVNLNLLYPQDLPQNIALKFIKWLLSIGRYITIIIEIIVLLAFAARFKLDMDLANIKEQINNQVPYIESLKPYEIAVKQTQFKLQTIKDKLDGNPNWQEVMTAIAKQTPVGITLTSVTFDNTDPTAKLPFKIAGTTGSNNDLGNFVDNLNHEPKFTDIVLLNVSSDQGQISFTITGNIK